MKTIINTLPNQELMKMMIKPMYYAFFLLLSVVSCNNEELFIEPTADVIVDNPVEDNGSGTTNTTKPCDFTFATVQSGDTVIINCRMDLNGQTIYLPSNVTIVYEGGDIINGTLNFKENSIISGELLNSTLKISGVIPRLEKPKFQFYPHRWAIVEGEVKDDVANSNKQILQSVIDLTKTMEASSFSIDKMDAYFLISGGFGSNVDHDKRAISIPSNIHFEMTDNTYLRVQPNKWPFSFLISILKKQNVTITGGNLMGDRYTHDYSPISDYGRPRNTHEWPGLLYVGASQNITVDNVNMLESTGDGFIAGSIGAPAAYPGVAKNDNIVIKNSTVKANRRNNMSITDGTNILIENCKVLEAGQGYGTSDSNGNPIYSSAGVAPRAGIDIEPYYGWDVLGNFSYYELAKNVIIRACVFKSNYSNSVINYTGHDVLIENNTSDGQLMAYHDNGTKFINNTLIASEEKRHTTGITTGGFSIGVGVNQVPTEFSKNSEVKGNTVKGFALAMQINGDTPTVSDNVVEDFEFGIIVQSNGVLCENNKVESQRVSWAYALTNRVSSRSGDYIFKGNSFKGGRTVWMEQLNNNQINGITLFDNNYFESFTNNQSGIDFKFANNITFKNNILVNVGLRVTDCSNYVEENNEIK